MYSAFSGHTLVPKPPRSLNRWSIVWTIWNNWKCCWTLPSRAAGLVNSVVHFPRNDAGECVHWEATAFMDPVQITWYGTYHGQLMVNLKPAEVRDRLDAVIGPYRESKPY